MVRAISILTGFHMKIIRLALAIAVIAVFAQDACAFGKRGKGLFGWRDSSSCQSCPTGSCASGTCVPNCANGQCVTTTPTGSSTGTTCINGRCYPAATTSSGQAWYDPVWKKK